MKTPLALLDDASYSSKLVLSMIDGYLAHKQAKGFIKRADGLFEDVTGNVFTLDVQVGASSINIRLKGVALGRTL